MVRLFKVSYSNKIAAIICTAIILVGVVFGIFTKYNFSHLSEFQSSYDNALFEIADEDKYVIDEMSNKTSYEEALCLLNEMDYIFKVKCLSTEHCYECTKYNVKVLDTIKGSIDETGNDIVLYQWVWFQNPDDSHLSFSSPDFSLPLQEKQEYLVFAQKRNYCKAYQNTLKSNEYAIPIRGSVPNVYVISDKQKITLILQMIILIQHWKINIICVFQKSL